MPRSSRDAARIRDVDRAARRGAAPTGRRAVLRFRRLRLVRTRLERPTERRARGRGPERRRRFQIFATPLIRARRAGRGIQARYAPECRAGRGNVQGRNSKNEPGHRRIERLGEIPLHSGPRRSVLRRRSRTLYDEFQDDERSFHLRAALRRHRSPDHIALPRRGLSRPHRGGLPRHAEGRGRRRIPPAQARRELRRHRPGEGEGGRQPVVAGLPPLFLIRSPWCKTERAWRGVRQAPPGITGGTSPAQSSSLSRFTIPAANHAPFGLRIRSTGLSQAAGGSGSSTPSIRKSPLGSSGTTGSVLCNVNGAVASQISVARTLWPALPPMPLPPASSRPRPLTLMLPSIFTSALRSAIVHSWPGGWTPRTMFRFTLSTVCAVASGGATATPAETGMTPIPPLNFTRESSAAAESG